MKSNLPREVYIGSTISLLLVILVGFLSFYTSSKQEEQERKVEQIYKVLTQVEHIQNIMIDMETSRRGFRGTKDKKYLEPYHAALLTIQPAFKKLELLVEAYPEQAAMVQMLEHKASDLQAFWRSLGEDASGYTEEIRASITNRERIKMDSFRQDIQKIKLIQQDLLEHRKKDNQFLRQSMIIAIGTGTLLILVIVAILVYVVIREFRSKVEAFEAEHRLNEQKSMFVTLASHEFRTPLSSIQLSASLIQKYVGQSKTDGILKHATKIKGSVEDLTSILNDFLSLERLDKGKIHANFESFDLVEACREIKEEMNMLIKPNQTLTYESAGLTRKVRLDKNLLKNCLVNLISNAIKYSGENSSITISSTITLDSCIVKVKDNGVGIPESEQKNLFQPFFRVSNVGNVPGTGLGLNIVSRYMELMEGKVSFESKPNQGTTFILSFPITNNSTNEKDRAEIAA